MFNGSSATRSLNHAAVTTPRLLPLFRGLLKAPSLRLPLPATKSRSSTTARSNMPSSLRTSSLYPISPHRLPFQKPAPVVTSATSPRPYQNTSVTDKVAVVNDGSIGYAIELAKRLRAIKPLLSTLARLNIKLANRLPFSKILKFMVMSRAWRTEVATVDLSGIENVIWQNWKNCESSVTPYSLFLCGL